MGGPARTEPLTIVAENTASATVPAVMMSERPLAADDGAAKRTARVILHGPARDERVEQRVGVGAREHVVVREAGRDPEPIDARDDRGGRHGSRLRYALHMLSKPRNDDLRHGKEPTPHG